MGAFRARGGRFERPWRGVATRRPGLNQGEAVGNVRRTLTFFTTWRAADLCSLVMPRRSHGSQAIGNQRLLGMS